MNTVLPTADDALPRDVLVTMCKYANGTFFPMHGHVQGQFAYALEGVITLLTDRGGWVVPPQRAIWVPANVPHAMRMRGPVTIFNAYLGEDAVRRAGLPAHCAVFDVSPLLRLLLDKAVDVPTLYAPDGRDAHLMGLLLHEIAAMPTLPLNAPLPATPRLADVCKAFLEQPSLTTGIDEMAARAGMSRRTFTRQFRAATGMSFIAWRQQACLLAAVVRLGRGEQVTRIAEELGYSTPSAFATVFKHMLGEVPSRYV